MGFNHHYHVVYYHSYLLNHDKWITNARAAGSEFICTVLCWDEGHEGSQQDHCIHLWQWDPYDVLLVPSHAVSRFRQTTTMYFYHQFWQRAWSELQWKMQIRPCKIKVNTAELLHKRFFYPTSLLEKHYPARHQKTVCWQRSRITILPQIRSEPSLKAKRL